MTFSHGIFSSFPPAQHVIQLKKRASVYLLMRSHFIDCLIFFRFLTWIHNKNSLTLHFTQHSPR